MGAPIKTNLGCINLWDHVNYHFLTTKAIKRTMKYQLVEKAPKNSAIILGFFSDEDISSQSHIQEFNLSHLIKSTLTPKIKHTSLWQEQSDNAVCLLNLGKHDAVIASSFQNALSQAVKQIKTLKITDVTLCLPNIESLNKPINLVIQSIESAFYQFSVRQKPNKAACLKNVNLLMNTTEKCIEQAAIVAKAINYTRDLGNLPANLCTPTTLAEKATEISNSNEHMSIKVLGEKEMEMLGMNTILAVSQGSREEAKFIEMTYKNGGNSAPIVLIGKGITFDSGGLSLKSPNAMVEMKFDMCGAASVLGTMLALGELQLPLNIIALVAASENLPGPDALKPGDVITSFSKKTIEVLNTDAEGRLVLCDALTYAEQFKPSKVIDIATLTGAIIVALGSKTNGIMANNQALCEELISAGQTANDKGWQLPLWDEYQSLMDSNVADVSNMANDRGAGSISAACFLSRFADQFPWAHIDCAGTAWKSGKNKSASGRPVPLLIQFLQDQVI